MNDISRKVPIYADRFFFQVCEWIVVGVTSYFWGINDKLIFYVL